MIKPFLLSSLLITLGISLTTCASAPDSDKEPKGIAAYKGDARLGDPVRSICFSRNIDGFRDAKKDTVIIEGSGRSEYLVSTRGCFRLRNAMAIGLERRDSCLRPGSALIVSDELTPAFGGTSTGMGPDRCLINEIYEWNQNAKPENAEGESDDADSTP